VRARRFLAPYNSGMGPRQANLLRGFGYILAAALIVGVVLDFQIAKIGMAVLWLLWLACDGAPKVITRVRR
jgi:hypothetical protein